MFGLIRRTLRALIALPRPVRRALAGPPATLDGQTLDLDVQMVLRLLGLVAGGDEPSLEEQRHVTDRAATLAWSATPGGTARPVHLPGGRPPPAPPPGPRPPPPGPARPPPRPASTPRPRSVTGPRRCSCTSTAG